MSEYQYYEFLAVDRPLTTAEQAEVRQLSTRARITATSFTNEYQWGDFKGSPDQLMQHYYDAHLYFANWGTHRIMLRLLRTLLDPTIAAQYCVGGQVRVSTTREHVILAPWPTSSASTLTSGGRGRDQRGTPHVDRRRTRAGQAYREAARQ